MKNQDSMEDNQHEADKYSNMYQQQNHNILSRSDLIQKFIVSLTKENLKTATRETKWNCKIAVFPTFESFEELESILNNLIHEQYPNLFTIVIISKDFKTLEESTNRFTTALLKFSVARPLLLQLTSEDKNVTKLLFKEANSNNFKNINQLDKDFNSSKNFPTFLCSFLSSNSSLNLVTENLQQVKNSSMIIRFLKLFNLPEEYCNNLLLDCVAYGSKNDLLAAIDAHFESDGRILSNESQKYLNKLIDNKKSVLLTAVKNSNKSIIDFLITNCTHLIQDLPFDHQVLVSTAAFESSQFDVFCDLLDISDFPFPKSFNIDYIEYDRLKIIVNERISFQEAIEKEYKNRISEFINKHLSLRIVYSNTNEPALKIAVDNQKFRAYYYLKSHGYRAIDIEDILEGQTLKDAEKFKCLQIRENVKNSLEDVNNPIHLLCTRSFVHNRIITNEQEVEYRKLIKKWFQDISKVEFGMELLEVVASCRSIKIIFDFESETTENVTLEPRSNSLGVMYPTSKWIIIGSKLSDHERSQQIKGVLAHELCHYAMKLVYENAEHPYYRHHKYIAEEFKAIVIATDKWSADDSDNPDDDCNGIISSVFQCYDEVDFEPELIVRVIQILANFDENEEVTNSLKDKYEELFEFYKNRVFADLKSFDLKFRESVRSFNRFVELLRSMSSTDIELSVKINHNIKDLLNDKITIVTTNISELLFVDIIRYLKDEFGVLMDVQNVFLDPKMLKNQEIMQQYNKLMTNYPQLRVFVDFTGYTASEVDSLYDIIVTISKSSFIFIVLSCDNLLELQNSKIINITYKWNDLTAETQMKLLKRKVNFQNNVQHSFYDIFKSNEKDVNILGEFSNIVDDQLLNSLLNNQQIITINPACQVDKYFEFLYYPRNMIKEEKDPSSEYFPKQSFMSEDQFIADVENLTFVLISDIAGNGKSWMMKNITNILLKDNPVCWITYVDLKQFIRDFKAHKGEVEFSSFMAEKILQFTHNFEAKIFQYLYSIGKVFILFDGFDEIAPDCAKFVAALISSFQSNQGNQLWIATRDYFEVDLKVLLQLETLYRLNHPEDDENIEQIVKLWLLNDFEKQNEIIKFDEFINKFKKLDYRVDYLNNYRKLAKNIYDKVLMKKHRWYTFGSPQMMKMIADISKDNKTAVIDLRQFHIFDKFIQNLYENWAYEKGQLRKTANINSQNLQLSFRKFHEYAAIKFTFPNYVQKFYSDYDGSEWPEEEVIAGGIISRQFGQLSFTHLSLSEYFIAELILRHLKSMNNDGALMFLFKSIFLRATNECIVLMLIDILTWEYHGVIRMLINEGLDDTALLDSIQPKMSLFMMRLYKMTFFSDYFTKSLDKLADFLIIIFRNGNYSKVCEILSKSIEKVMKDTDDLSMFLKFTDFLFEFLNDKDLKDLLINEKVLEHALKFNPNAKIFENFVAIIEEKFGIEFVKHLLNLCLNNKSDESILHILSEDQNKTEKIFPIIRRYFNNSEVIDLTKILNKDKENVLHTCASKGNSVLLLELETIFLSQNKNEMFKELLMQEDKYECNILTMLHPSFEFNKVFWKLILKYITSSEELMDFVLKEKKFSRTSIHYLVRFSNASFCDLTFKILKENLSSIQFKQVLSIHDEFSRNILQIAAFERHLSVENHQVLWNIVRNSCKTDKEFMDVVNEGDWDGVNILCHAVHNNSPEVIQFMIRQLETMCSREELEKILCNLDVLGRNLLLLSAIAIKSLEIHVFLWNVFENYVEPSIIFKYIQSCRGEYGCNILMCATFYNKIEIVKFIWEKIKGILKRKEEQVEYLRSVDLYKEDIRKYSIRNQINQKVHKWTINLMRDYGMLDE